MTTRFWLAAALLSSIPLASALSQSLPVNLSAPQRTRIVPLLSPAGVIAETLTLPDDLKGRLGELDYAVQVAQEGWYLVAGRSASAPTRLRVTVDPTGEEPLPPAPVWKDGRFQAGWVRLGAGRHVVRLQNYHWQGFPALQALWLERARPDSNPMRLVGRQSRVYRTGACEPLVVETGGNANAFTIITSIAPANGVTTFQTAIAPPSVEVLKTRIDLPCRDAGDYAVELRASSTSAEMKAIRFSYSVSDTQPVTATFRKDRLVVDIRAADTVPDYASGATSVVKSSGAPVRVSGQQGLTPFSRGQTREQPSWFAYTLAGLRPGVPHVVEIEYPDDGKRAFVAAIKEQGTRSYPVSLGVNTGGEWPISHATQSLEALFWPASAAPRLVLLPVHNGDTAAASRIRVFEAEGTLSPRPVPATNRRAFRIWSEEGLSFLDTVTLRERGRLQEAVDRWLASLSDTGVTMVSPTVLIYSFSLYPSRYNLTFAEEWGDTLETILLGAERHGMRVVPQLHPRADELAWVEPGQDLRSRLLLSKDGVTNLFTPDGSKRNFPPHYDPFDPVVQDWYVGMIGELADRFRGSRSFAGIDLRQTHWQNPTLNNLASLDWGYDSRSVRRFFADRGIAFPADLASFAENDPAGAKARHARLVGQYRGAWIAWRCEQIAKLFERIRDRVRAARPDLVIYVTTTGFDSTPGLGAARRPAVAGLLEAGLDPVRLGAIEGVILIDAQKSFGRRENPDAWGRDQRQKGMDARSYEPFRTASHPPFVNHNKQYIEASGEVAPFERLGLPARSPAPWISSALEPPGRLPLERFATALGLSDAAMLGWGGNGYARMPPVARDFIRIFTQLPAVPFRKLSAAPDSLAVWSGPGYAYLVNMQPFALKAGLTVTPNSELAPLASSRALVRDDAGALSITLDAFELAAFTLSPGAEILSASVELPKTVSSDYAARFAEHDGSTRLACSAPSSRGDRRATCDAHVAALSEAGGLFKAGAVWAARRILESADFQSRADKLAVP